METRKIIEVCYLTLPVAASRLLLQFVDQQATLTVTYQVKGALQAGVTGFAIGVRQEKIHSSELPKRHCRSLLFGLAKVRYPSVVHRNRYSHGTHSDVPSTNRRPLLRKSDKPLTF